MTPSWIICLDARFGCYQCSQVHRSRDVSHSLVSNSGLVCAECGLIDTVLRETREEPFERPLPNVVDVSSPLLLQHRVAVHSQNVIDAADSQTSKLVDDFSSPLLLKGCVAVNSQDVVDAANSHTRS